VSQLVPDTTLENAIATWVEGAGGVPTFWAEQDGERPATPYVELVLVIEPTGSDWSARTENPLVFADKPVTGASTVTNRLTVVAHGLATGDGPVRPKNVGGAPAAPLATGTDYWVIRDDADHLRLATSLYRANAGTAVALIDAGTGTNTIASTADTRTRGAEVLEHSRGLRRCHLTLQCFAAAATGVAGAKGILSTVQAKATLPTYRAALRTGGASVPSFGSVQGSGKAMNSAHFEPRAILECTFFAAQDVTEPGTYVEFVQVTEQVTTGNGTALPDQTVYAPSDPAA
jgi:hypothetical protein